MTDDIQKKVREFILAELRARNGVIDDSNIKNNLIESGIIDSFGFLELLMAVEREFHVQMNLLEVDPSEFTYFEGLTNLCVQAYMQKNEQS